jgi:hypothetical protein
MFVRCLTLGFSVFAIAACVSSPKLPETAAPTAVPAPAPIVAPQPATPSALSYGIVTSQVRKGETTQLDLVQLFGSPNISTYDSAGIETWVYERTVTQTDVQSNTKAVQGAANLGVFFNFGNAGAGVAGSQSTQAASTASSVRSITVIVKFNDKKIVSDYSVRASYF